MTGLRHRKAIRAGLMAARSLAADLNKRRGHLPNMAPDALDGFAQGVRTLCALIEQERPALVREAKDMALAADVPWHAGHALITVLNVEAGRQNVDAYTKTLDTTRPDDQIDQTERHAE